MHRTSGSRLSEWKHMCPRSLAMLLSSVLYFLAQCSADSVERSHLSPPLLPHALSALCLLPVDAPGSLRRTRLPLPWQLRQPRLATERPRRPLLALRPLVARLLKQLQRHPLRQQHPVLLVQRKLPPSPSGSAGWASTLPTLRTRRCCPSHPRLSQLPSPPVGASATAGG